MIKLKNILLEDTQPAKQTVDSLRQGAKIFNGLYSGTLPWKKYLRNVGKSYPTSTGPKRNELSNPDWAELPDWLKGEGSHPYGDNIWLWPSAAQAFVRMRDDAKKDGVTITVTSSYRDVFHQALVSKLNTSGKTGLPVAKVGRSNHGLGLAIDVSRGAGRDWMIDNGLRYGWVWYGKKDEPHFNYYPALLSNGLGFGSHVPKSKLKRYLRKPKKMVKIEIPGLYTALELINNDSDKNKKIKNNIGHYDSAINSPNEYKYPIIDSAKFEAWKDSTDKRSGKKFGQLYPTVLVGDVNSDEPINSRTYDSETGEWEKGIKLIKQVTVSPSQAPDK